MSKEKLPRDQIYKEYEYLQEKYVSHYAVLDSHPLLTAKITKKKTAKIKVSTVEPQLPWEVFIKVLKVLNKPVSTFYVSSKHYNWHKANI